MKHVSEYVGKAVEEIIERSDMSRAETWQWLLTHLPRAAQDMKRGKELGMTFEQPRVRRR